MGVIEAFGKFQIYGFVFTLFLISVIFFGIGIWIIRQPADTVHTSNIQGVYSNVTCAANQCTARVLYTIPCNTANCVAKTYILNDQFGQIKEGDSLTVYYAPGNPSDAKAKPGASKGLGWGMTIVSLFFMLLAFFIGRKFYTASNNNRQSYARLAAAGGAASYFS